MSALSILIVDDEQRIREELSEFLAGCDYPCSTAATPTAALREIETGNIDIVILDINLPERDGIEVLREIKARDDNIEVIMITGQGDMDLAIKAMRLGAADFFNKPIRLNEVLLAIQRSTRYVSLNRQFHRIRQSYDQLSRELMQNLGLEIIGNSPQIKNLLKDISIAAQNPETPVMICG